jgi:hypothetical protein
MSKFDEMVAKEMEDLECINRLQRVEARNQRIAKSNEDKRRNYIIGELVSKYFKEVLNFKRGTKAENSIEFAPLEEFISILANDRKLIEELKQEVNLRLSKKDQ